MVSRVEFSFHNRFSMIFGVSFLSKFFFTSSEVKCQEQLVILHYARSERFIDEMYLLGDCSSGVFQNQLKNEYLLQDMCYRKTFKLTAQNNNSLLLPIHQVRSSGIVRVIEIHFACEIVKRQFIFCLFNITLNINAMLPIVTVP